MSKLLTPEELLELNLWPKEEEEEEEMEVIEEPSSEPKCMLDDVPISQWDEARMEACLKHYRDKTWQKSERTYQRQVTPPTLVSVEPAGEDDKNHCTFRHPSGEEKRILVKRTILYDIHEYRPMVMKAGWVAH